MPPARRVSKTEVDKMLRRWQELMTISGHKPSGVHDGYIHLTDTMLVNHFREKGLLLSPAERKAAVGS